MSLYLKSITDGIGHQYSAAVNNHVGIVKARVTGLFISRAVISHVQVHGIISCHNVGKQLPVSFAGSLLVFIN